MQLRRLLAVQPVGITPPVTVPVARASPLRALPQAPPFPSKVTPVDRMDEVVALGTDRHQIHEPFIAQVLVRAVMQVHSRPTWAVADVTILGHLGRPIPLTHCSPRWAVDVGTVTGSGDGRFPWHTHGCPLCADEVGGSDHGLIVTTPSNMLILLISKTPVCQRWGAF